jgi:hypothetical protein
MKNLELPLTKLKGVTTDGAPSMTGKKVHLTDGIRREMGKRNPECYMEIQCIFHQESLGGKTVKSEHIMKVVISVPNFVRSHVINHRQFQSLSSETTTEYGDVFTKLKSDARIMGQFKYVLALRLNSMMKLSLGFGTSK